MPYFAQSAFLHLAHHRALNGILELSWTLYTDLGERQADGLRA